MIFEWISCLKHGLNLNFFEHKVMVFLKIKDAEVDAFSKKTDEKTELSMTKWIPI